MSDHVMSRAAEPGIREMSRAIYVTLYTAREMLFLAERQARADRPDPKVALAQLDAAISMLRSCLALLHEAAAETRFEVLYNHGLHAAEAARGHVSRYDSYRRGTNKLEQDKLAQLLPIWRKSAEEARKDVHRALTFTCERWPHCFDDVEEVT